MAEMRTRSPVGVIVHSPGVTYVAAVAKALGHRAGDDEVLDEGVAKGLDGREYRPGYLIGRSGIVYLLERDDTHTSHAASLSKAHYSMHWRRWARPLGGEGWIEHGRDGHVVYDWWDRAFGADTSPLDLPTGRYPNRAIGVDIRPSPTDGSFAALQIAALGVLVRALATCHNFAPDSRHILTHSLAAPLERGTVLRGSRVIGVHWDPPAKHYRHAAVLAALKESET